MEYREHQLPNGLTIAAEVNPNAFTAAYGFFVKAGSRDENPEIEGVSHFLEHMVFKGTADRSAEEINLLLDELGSNSNARTDEESTVYHASVLPEFQSEVVALLADLMRPALRLADFEVEKQVILEEIKMYADQPPYGGYERIMKEFFGQHPMGLSVLGTESSVGQLTPDRMMDYFVTRYSPSNMMLAASGKVDFESLVQQVGELCGNWSPRSAPRSSTPAEYHSGFAIMEQPIATQQYILQLFPGPAKDHPLRYATRLMSLMVGGEGASRMFWEFLDTGLAESVALGGYEFLDCGCLMTFLSCDPADAQSNLEQLARLLDEVTQHPLTEHELELAKSKAVAAIVLGSERTENRLFSVGGQWLSGRPFQTVAEICQKYEQITLSEIHQAVQQFPFGIGAGNGFTLTVGPRTDLRPIADH
jgi:predicted Zn-dependent peptidase